MMPGSNEELLFMRAVDDLEVGHSRGIEDARVYGDARISTVTKVVGHLRRGALPV